MSKSKKHKYYEDEEDFDSDASYNEYREKKRNKRIRHALKTKSIEALIHLSEDDEYF